MSHASAGMHTFGRGGIHPGPHKEATAERAIEILPAPDEIVLPLSQCLGDPSEPIVKKNEIVRRGQKIADGGRTGVPLHAPIGGKIRPVEKRPHPTAAIAMSIAITATPDAGPELEFPEDPQWRSLSAADAIERIREAGIVGLGGAAFPTWRKLEFTLIPLLPEGVIASSLSVALHDAASAGFTNVIKELLDRKADVNAKDNGGKNGYPHADQPGVRDFRP